MRALAEAPRLLFHYTNIEYDDLMSWDYYGKDWAEIKPNIPFKQLPMLIVDKKHEIALVASKDSLPKEYPKISDSREPTGTLKNSVEVTYT